MRPAGLTCKLKPRAQKSEQIGINSVTKVELGSYSPDPEIQSAFVLAVLFFGGKKALLICWFKLKKEKIKRRQQQIKSRKDDGYFGGGRGKRPRSFYTTMVLPSPSFFSLSLFFPPARRALASSARSRRA
jgi:hypothetical protein